MFEIGDTVHFEFRREKYKGKILKIMKYCYEVEMARGVIMVIDKGWIIT